MRAEHYPAIVLGATVRGCGIAAATPGSLILDPEIRGETSRRPSGLRKTT